MNRSIDTNLFLEIIETEGCIHAFSDTRDEFRIEHYLSVNNTCRVLIDASEDSLDEVYCSRILSKLNLDNLISLIPFN